jgi:hypothetical protein
MNQPQILLLLSSLAAVSPAIAGNCSSKPYTPPSRVSPANSQTVTVTVVSAAPALPLPQDSCERAYECEFKDGRLFFDLGICYCTVSKEHVCPLYDPVNYKREFIDLSEIENQDNFTTCSVYVILPRARKVVIENRSRIDGKILRASNPLDIVSASEAHCRIKALCEPILKAMQSGVEVSAKNAKYVRYYLTLFGDRKTYLEIFGDESDSD